MSDFLWGVRTFCALGLLGFAVYRSFGCGNHEGAAVAALAALAAGLGLLGQPRKDPTEAPTRFASHSALTETPNRKIPTGGSGTAWPYRLPEPIPPPPPARRA